MPKLFRQILFYYLIAVNVLAFVLMGIDKRRAKQNAWRIPEKTLFLPAIFGGALGGVAGMRLFLPQDPLLVLQIWLPPAAAPPAGRGGLVPLAVPGIKNFFFRYSSPAIGPDYPQTQCKGGLDHAGKAQGPHPAHPDPGCPAAPGAAEAAPDPGQPADPQQPLKIPTHVYPPAGRTAATVRRNFCV